MKQATIVLQAYGTDTIIHQNMVCLLSLLHQADLNAIARVLVYTDRADQFQKFFNHEWARAHVQYEDLSPERVKSWRGAINFVHRVKIEMLRDAVIKTGDSVVFYVDGDTIFIRDPSPMFGQIDARNSVMHELENIIDLGGDPISKKLTRFLQKSWRPDDEVGRGLTSGIAMWNAGVLGFSQHFAPHLDEVLYLTEKLYTAYPKHVMEQLAFSYCLRAHTRIRDARDSILHYWREKDLYNERIRQFLNAHSTATQALDQMAKAFELPMR